MPSTPTIFRQEGPIRALRLLFWLRTLAIVTQTAIIVTVHFVLSLPLPLTPLFVAIAVLVIWNAIVYPQVRENPRVSSNVVVLNLLVDIGAFTTVIYFTGGSTNPFVSLYLVPIALAAAALPARHAWFVVGICAACYTLVVLDHVPLPSVDERFGGDFNLHVTGMWINFFFAAGLMAVFIGAMARLVRQRDQELNELREREMQNQQVVALGALAAGTAHELNTPLSTIRLLVDEIGESLDSGRLKPQLKAMNEQLAVISTRLNEIVEDAGVHSAKSARCLRVRDFVEGITKRWSGVHPDFRVDFNLDEPFDDVEIVAEATIGQAITNVLDNAARASSASGADTIVVQVSSRGNQLTISVLDDGIGLAAGDNLLGEPDSSREDGLGVGLLLSRASLKQYGGDIELQDRREGGVTARIVLPLNDLVVHSGA